LRRELVIDESLRTFKVATEDKKFRAKFLDFLVKKHFGQTVLAHDVYRDLYPLDRGHNVMKSTCWETLGVFISQLRKDGRIEAQKGVKGWQIRVSDHAQFEDPSGGEENQASITMVGGLKRKHEAKQDDRKKVIIAPHSESSKRVSESKVVFNLGIASKRGFAHAKAGPTAFCTGDSEDEGSP